MTQKELKKISRFSQKRQAITWILLGCIILGAMLALVCGAHDVFGGNVAAVMIIPGLVMIAIGIYHAILAAVQASDTKEYKENLLKSDMSTIDTMDGITFENFLVALFERDGYLVNTTKRSGDYGVDLILQKGEKQIIIQAKRYAKKVSIAAIQQICAAREFYHIDEAWVITNNFFTEPAKNLANANGVRLINRAELAKIIVSGGNQTI